MGEVDDFALLDVMKIVEHQAEAGERLPGAKELFVTMKLPFFGISSQVNGAEVTQQIIV